MSNQTLHLMPQKASVYFKVQSPLVDIVIMIEARKKSGDKSFVSLNLTKYLCINLTKL